MRGVKGKGDVKHGDKGGNERSCEKEGEQESEGKANEQKRLN